MTANLPTVTSTGLSPSVVRKGMRLSIIEGAFANAYININTIASSFAMGFLTSLGATPLHFGILNGLPFIGQVAQFAAGYLQERVGQRRRLVIQAVLIERTLLAIIAVLPMLLLPPELAILIMLIVLGFSQLSAGIAANAWTSWMGDLIPAHQRGRFFGTRNTVLSIVAMVVVYGGGVFLDYYRSNQQQNLGFSLLFAFGIVAGWVGVGLLFGQPEPPLAPRIKRDTPIFFAPMQDKPFRQFALATLAWNVSLGVSSPFFLNYGFTTLHITFSQWALLSAVTSAISLVSYGVTGWLQDRYGDRIVMLICIVGVAPLPWGWFLSTPQNLIPLWLTQIGAGIFWPGVLQGMNNTLLKLSPSAERGAYIAVYSALGGVGNFAAGLLAGVIASSLGTILLSFGPITLDHVSIFFLLSSLGRLATLFYFRKVLSST